MGSYDGTSIVLQFNDTGCGISKEKCSELMCMLNNNDAENIKNNGGLSQVKMLLAPYNPCFAVDSIPGSTNITIQFPL